MFKKQRLYLQGTLALLLLFTHGAIKAKERPPLSVVMISVDMLRRDALGAYSNEEPSPTPHIDRFARAEKTVIFHRAYSHATFTVPAHVTLLSAVDPVKHGRLSNVVAESHFPSPNLPEVFQKAGYDTAAFTAGFLDKERGFDKGFDLFENFGHNTTDPSVGFREAQEWVAERKKTGRPFFLFIHSFHVHNHLQDSSGERIHNRTFLEESGFDARLAGYGTLIKTTDPGAPAALRQKLRKSYQKSVREIDAALGEFLESVDKHSTLVILTSDHGESFLEDHGTPGEWVYGHGRPYESALGIPLLLHWPRAPEVLTLPRPVGQWDIAPTLLELLGLPIPASFQGRSLAPLLWGKEKHRNRPFYFVGRGDGTVAGVQQGNLKLIQIGTFSEGKMLHRYEFYDLDQDHLEQNNLYTKKNPHIRRMQKKLEAHLKKNEFVRKTFTLYQKQKGVDPQEALRFLGYLE